jgi:hypothetical protein
MKMKRYWVSWESAYTINVGCTEPHFQVWESGFFENAQGKEILTLCAVLDADSEDQIWAAIKRHYPDYKGRFIGQRADDWNPSGPNSRFPGFDGRTSLDRP